jgi:hypothetical protein
LEGPKKKTPRVLDIQNKAPKAHLGIAFEMKCTHIVRNLNPKFMKWLEVQLEA